MSTESSRHPPAYDQITAALGGAALAILLANVVLIAIDVLMRSLFRSPQSWVADVAQVSYPVAIACCIPVALGTGHMIVIRFLGDAAGPRTSRALDLLGNLTMGLLLALFTWKMFERAASDMATGYKTSNIALPVAPTWWIVAGLLLLSTLLQIRVTWRQAVRQ